MRFPGFPEEKNRIFPEKITVKNTAFEVILIQIDSLQPREILTP